MIELSISTSFENRVREFTNTIYRTCANYKWFEDINDKTVIDDLKRIERENLTLEERSIEKEIAFRVINEFDCSEIFSANWKYLGLRKFRRYYSDRNGMKNELLNEVNNSKKLYTQFKNSKKQKKDIETFITESFKQCPLINVIGMYECYSNY